MYYYDILLPYGHVDCVDLQLGEESIVIFRAMLVMMTVVILALLGTGTSNAVPLGTTPVVASMKACNDDAFEQWISCGAAYTETWLEQQSLRGVVSSTVFAPNWTFGVWQSETTGGICGYVELGGFGFGMHHCDGISFVSITSDPSMITSVNAAIVALAHESGHGMQERAGIDPVVTTLVNPKGAQLFPLEQSSDCWAGAAFKWYVQQGMRTMSDKYDATAFVRSVGQEGDKGHGSPDQREAAFNNGFNNGSGACNTYVDSVVFPTS